MIDWALNVRRLVLQLNWRSGENNGFEHHSIWVISSFSHGLFLEFTYCGVGTSFLVVNDYIISFSCSLFLEFTCCGVGTSFLVANDYIISFSNGLALEFTCCVVGTSFPVVNDYIISSFPFGSSLVFTCCVVGTSLPAVTSTTVSCARLGSTAQTPTWRTQVSSVMLAWPAHPAPGTRPSVLQVREPVCCVFTTAIHQFTVSPFS